MDLNALGSIGVGILVLVWVGYRQTTWRVVDASRKWRLPLILGVIGIVSLFDAKAPLSEVDLAALVIELVVSAATGAWMGAMAHFRLAASDTRSARWESRTGWWGLALWVLVIAVRVGIDVVAVRLGAGNVTSTGVILLVVAANRLARVAVVLNRAGRLDAGTAVRQPTPV